ncbi:MAG: OmpA family protein [Actinophytocola sp.]|uniref:OmpA family protein n=1 Tax=Actinophytocola sp. TaxID=1872138 RepID=UPI003D6A2F15
MRGSIPWLVAVLTALVAGCSGTSEGETSPPRCATESSVPFAAAIGARANSDTPRLPDSLASLMTATARNKQEVTLVRADGDPSVAYAETFVSSARNDPAEDEDFEPFLADLRTAFAEATKATKGEADPLAALTLAARAVPSGGNVVLVDSGLQTVPPLRFQDESANLLDADPAEVADHLREQDLLPDLTGRKVVLVGLGNTAPPQPTLNTRQFRKVAAIWRAIADAGGAACVEVLDDPGTKTAVSDTPPVAVVRLPEPPPPPKPCGETVLGERNDVGFVRDEAAFLDEGAARATIQRVADVMRDGRQSGELVGTTANVGDLDGQVRLSKQRAEAVRRVLEDMGIDGARLRTVGLGSKFDGYVRDHAADGTLLPGPAAQNRKVTVRLNCPAD